MWKLFDFRVSFELGFMLRFVSMFNELLIWHFYQLLCGKENTCVLNTIFLVKNVSVEHRFVFLVLKPAAFLYSIKQVLRFRRGLPASAKRYVQVESFKSFIESMNKAVKLLAKSYPNLSGKLLYAKESITKAYSGASLVALDVYRRAHSTKVISIEDLSLENITYFMKIHDKICNHDTERRYCKSCQNEGTGGDGLCHRHHGNKKSECKKCFEEGIAVSGLCHHGNQKSKCKKCDSEGTCCHNQVQGPCTECAKLRVSSYPITAVKSQLSKLGVAYNRTVNNLLRERKLINEDVDTFLRELLFNEQIRLVPSIMLNK